MNEQLRTGFAERQAELAYLERQASVAAGCDYLVRLCPDSLVEPGRKAQLDGMGGGTSAFFWSIFLVKLVILGAMLGTCIVTTAWGWVRFTAPAKAASTRAERLIDEAKKRGTEWEERAAKAEKRTAQAESQFAELSRLSREAATAATAAEESLKETEAKVLHQQQLLRDTEKVSAALTAAFR